MRDKQHLAFAKEIIANTSDDPNTKIGAVIARYSSEDSQSFVVAVGSNRLPYKIEKKEERLQRPIKYSYLEHAERDAIYSAARLGTPLWGTTLYTQCMPCGDCARAIIQSGIKRVVVEFEPSEEKMPKWVESCKFGKDLLQEAGLEITIYGE